MAEYTFSTSRIDHHVEHIGIDVRPVIEVRYDRAKLDQYAAWLTEKWPTFYESTVIGPTDFRLTKRFVFPGQGETEHLTFGLTNRGPSFAFPKLISPFNQEVELPQGLSVNEIVREALAEFRRMWPQCNHIRCGKVTEYIFDCGEYGALEVLRQRFTRWPSIPATGELRIRVNLPDDDYNRIIQMEPVAKAQVTAAGIVQEEGLGSGIKIRADVNNRDTSNDMDAGRQRAVLDRADRFFTDELLPILNGGR